MFALRYSDTEREFKIKEGREKRDYPEYAVAKFPRRKGWRQF